MRKQYEKITGMMPILPSLVDDRGEPDLKAQARTVDYLLEGGAVAIGHMGGASDYYKVDDGDREKFVRSLIEQVAGRVPVFVGTAHTSLKGTIRHSENAAKWGADMLMVCSPIAGAVLRDELAMYYEEVAKAVQTTIIVQDTGASAGVYTAEFLLELYERVETVGYTKAEGSGGLQKLAKLQELAKGKFQVIGGNGGFGMLFLLRHGIEAFMTGTECTDVHNDVVRAFLAGDEEKASYLYHTTVLSYLQYFGMYTRYFLKYMLKRRGIVDRVINIFPDEQGEPSPCIMEAMDKTLDEINKIRGKDIL